MNAIDKPIEPKFKQAQLIEGVCPVGTKAGMVLESGTLTLERGRHAGYAYTTTIAGESIDASADYAHFEKCYTDHGSD